MQQSIKSVGHYYISQVIGQGAYGKVRLATHSQTGYKVAIKKIQKAKLSSQSDLFKLNQELSILRQVRHPCIIQLYEIIETSKNIYVVTEYCSKGDLYHYIKRYGKLNERVACRFFHQVVQGVRYLHSIGITHRDIKPQNIVIDRRNRIKIIDFGYAGWIVNGMNFKEAFGSIGYSAPEVMRGKYYNPIKADIWSIGVVLFTMVCGQQPFESTNPQDLYNQLKFQKIKFPFQGSEDFRDLIRQILQFNSESRISLEQIKAHCWYQQIKHFELRGIKVGIDQIPIDEQVLKITKRYGLDQNFTRYSVIQNKHNNNTVVYYIVSRMLQERQQRESTNNNYNITRYNTPSNLRRTFQKSFSPEQCRQKKFSLEYRNALMAKSRSPGLKCRIVWQQNLPKTTQNSFLNSPASKMPIRQNMQAIKTRMQYQTSNLKLSQLKSIVKMVKKYPFLPKIKTFVLYFRDLF